MGPMLPGKNVASPHEKQKQSQPQVTTLNKCEPQQVASTTGLLQKHGILIDSKADSRAAYAKNVATYAKNVAQCGNIAAQAQDRASTATATMMPTVEGGENVGLLQHVELLEDVAVAEDQPNEAICLNSAAAFLTDMIHRSCNNKTVAMMTATATVATLQNLADESQQACESDAEITIDFNRRRRRGRLRNDRDFATTTATTTATIETNAIKEKSRENTAISTPTRETITTTATVVTPLTEPPPPVPPATTTKQILPPSSTLASFFNFIRLSLLLLPSMAAISCIAENALCFTQKIVTTTAITTPRFRLLEKQLNCCSWNFVNRIKKLVVSSSTKGSPATASQAASSTILLSTTTTTATKPAVDGATEAAAAAAFLSNNENTHPHRRRRHCLAAATAKAATAKATPRVVNTIPRLHGSGLSWKHLFYVLLLFTDALPGSSNHLLVAAAKPKSATQPHQQQTSNNQLQLYSAGAGAGNAAHTPPSYHVVASREEEEEGGDDVELLYPSSQSEEQLFDEANMAEENNDDDQNAAYENAFNATTLANTTIEIKTPLFPRDLFSKQQLEDGWVFCHILGVIYMFVALAIVCDEFFVPSLDVIIEKLGITDDVAGATFMAAGGSAPELFTSVIGVFVSFDDVGIGTIVGSAVFNILFVIGMCALFSKTVLTLTWWPLFRDCSFYSISLIVLIIFFRDNRIYWYEALTLFSIYVCYVAFMKWNVQVERFVKKLITRNQGNAANSSETSMATQPGGSVTSRAASETRSGPGGSSSGGGGATGNSGGSTQTGAKFRHGLLQLMIHTIDPLHDDDVPGKVDEKATQLHAIASLKVLLDATKPQRGGATTSAANHVKINLKETTLADRPNGNIDTTLDSPSLSGRRPSWIEQRVKVQTRKFSIKTAEIEDEPEPLSMAWPDTARKRLTYILVAPLLIPMWLTLPDTRAPRGKKFFAITFIGSILWIAAFSYLMVWWANVAGDTARIPPEVMGLTFLAAGTSIPDLITSVIVARKGYGDMAVSSSVGSNIFDVTVGLPIPWLLYGLIYGAPVEVNSVGMVCSITILFMMLLFVVMSIACFRWRMNKGLGFTMFLLYFVFVAVSLMFEYDFIRCPV